MNIRVPAVGPAGARDPSIWRGSLKPKGKDRPAQMRQSGAVFDAESSPWGRVDYALLQNGFVHLFWRRRVLSEATNWLIEHGYEVLPFDAADWALESDFHRDVKAALEFPDYYGSNLNALNDCLGDVALGEYGYPREKSGLVVVLDRYDEFARRLPDVAQAVLEIFASQARQALLFGHRILCLVQSDDPDIHFQPVGAHSVMWNPAEAIRINRQPYPGRPTGIVVYKANEHWRFALTPLIPDWHDPILRGAPADWKGAEATLLALLREDYQVEPDSDWHTDETGAFEARLRPC